MKKIYFTLIIFYSLFSIISEGQNTSPKKELHKTETHKKEKSDSIFLYQCVTHSFPKKESLYFEFFGNSANLYSLNYDRSFFVQTLKPCRWARYSIRIGVNYFEGKYALPLMFHFSRGKEHCFEAGAGWVPWFSENKRVDGIAAFTGFRFQPVITGLLARFGITPTYLIQEKNHWRMVYGFSFGVAY